MKTSLFRLLRLFAVCFAAFLPSSAYLHAQTAAGAATGQMNADYVFSVVDAGAHLARVRLSLSGVPAGDLTLAFNPVMDFTVEDVRFGSGNTPAVLRAPGRLTLAGAHGGSITLVYSLRLAIREAEQRPYGFLCSTYLLTQSSWSFLVPESVDANEYRVRFELPQGWRPVTPWRDADGGFVERNPRIFRESTFAAGRFETRTFTVGRVTMRVAVDEGFESAHRERLFMAAPAIFAYIKNLFGADASFSHLSIFAKPNGPNEWQYVNENGLSEGEAPGDFRGACYQFSHRIFHTFNGFYPFGMDIGATWFLEGVNEYYDRLAMARVGGELPFAGLVDFYRTIYLPNRSRYDTPLIGNTRDPGNNEREQFLAYKKGALVSLLLDLAIRSASSGARSLADVLSYLYARQGSFAGHTITDETIRSAVATVAGRDLSTFFDAYIDRTTPLDLEALLSDEDIDGLPNAYETIIGTDPSRADTDGDRASDGYEATRRTDPLTMNAPSPGRSIRADGFAWEWGTEASGVFSYRIEGAFLCVLLRFPETANWVRTQPRLRYYLNVDTDRNGVANRQFAAVFGTPGDFSFFNEDWSNYGWESMSFESSLESGVAEVAEFRIPLALLGGTRRISISAGVWDGSTNSALASTNWMPVNW